VDELDEDGKPDSDEGPGFAVTFVGSAVEKMAGRQTLEFLGGLDSAGCDITEGLLVRASSILVGSIQGKMGFCQYRYVLGS